MLTACPNGHGSSTGDYCDQCGTRIADEPAPSQPETQAEPEVCSRCATLRVDDDLFCETCGHRFGPTPEQARWEVLITADHEHYERAGGAQVEFPASAMPRVMPLTGEEIRIGRRSASRDVDPEIDLSLAPEDPAISHLHAVLVREAGGTYAVRDLGSTNGTFVNDEPTAIAADVPRSLNDGDQVHIGAWTTLTLQARKTD